MINLWVDDSVDEAYVRACAQALRAAAKRTRPALAGDATAAGTAARRHGR